MLVLVVVHVIELVVVRVILIIMIVVVVGCGVVDAVDAERAWVASYFATESDAWRPFGPALWHVGSHGSNWGCLAQPVHCLLRATQWVANVRYECEARTIASSQGAESSHRLPPARSRSHSHSNKSLQRPEWPRCRLDADPCRPEPQG